MGKGAWHQSCRVGKIARTRRAHADTIVRRDFTHPTSPDTDEISEPLNAIDLEVIYQSTLQIARELTLNMLRTGYSTIIKESQDFTFAIFDGAGPHGGAGHSAAAPYRAAGGAGERDPEALPR